MFGKAKNLFHPFFLRTAVLIGATVVVCVVAVVQFPG